MDKSIQTEAAFVSEIPLEYYYVAIGIIGTTDEFSDYHRICPMLPDNEVFQRIADDLIEAGVFDEDRGLHFDSIEEAIDMLKQYLAEKHHKKDISEDDTTAISGSLP